MDSPTPLTPPTPPPRKNDGGSKMPAASPLTFPGMRVFSFPCSPGGVALTSAELALLAAHPANGGSERSAELVRRLMGDAAVDGSLLADVLPAVAQVNNFPFTVAQ
jgi:hypothetical protein